DNGRQYVAEIYADGPDADYRTNQTDTRIEHTTVTRDSVLTVRMAPGGGQAVRFHPQEAR
ncbi:MAG: glycoside hydrolase family 97 C-terminal domain-containing protein, partial [Rhodothermales bacterium]